MACFKPWDLEQPKASGLYVTLPCGRCIGCRMAHRRMWAARLVHESYSYPDTSFLTLTYSDEHLPTSGQLVLPHLQKFFKRLRKAHGKFRYYACGEYGGQTLRPHYHSVMFGYRPDDLKLHAEGESHHTYTSAKLEAIWGHGFVTVGDVNPETCAYVAGYVTKKITGPQAETHYQRLHTHSGELVQVPPEFAVMSRRPGLGRSYYDQYRQELLAHDNIVFQGHEMPVPKYYDKLLERDDLTELHRLKENRRRRARENKSEQTPQRLASREECATARANLNQRKN